MASLEAAGGIGFLMVKFRIWCAVATLVQRDATIDEIRSVVSTDSANCAVIRLSGTNQLELSLLYG